MNPISTEALYEIYLNHPSVTTDTRKISKGDIFFALKGDNFNGNKFAQQALDNGASYAVVDELNYVTSERTIYCFDVLTALQNLALHHRQQLNIPVIAITGSNGKTTTKELVHAVLSSKYKTYTTEGNLNNHIGIPVTLLRIKNDAEIAVVEMGANHQKEIEGYCRYTLPTHGMITNCGKAHLEGFGGIEGVRKGKGELFDYLKASGGVVFACDDFDYFHTMTTGIKQLHWYGTLNGELTGSLLKSEPFLQLQVNKGFDNELLIDTNLVGAYNIFNVLAALTIGRHFNVNADQMVAAIEGYEPTNNRSQLIEKNGNRIILDAYNANPTSMQAAIENFAALPAENKILFLGGMMELGVESINEHAALISLIKKFKWKQVILVGGDFANVKHEFLYFNNASDAAGWWKQQNASGNYLLVKGSRSVKMEQIIT
jgi:UDP-N-acetylmuramoyl-tripeptide--D-alanyl-D-alanine ligase